MSVNALRPCWDWAIAQGYRYDNPAGKAIPKVLPRQPRVKARRDHRVPLSKRALAILTRAQDLRVEGGDLVFPGRGERPLSDMVHTTMPQRLGIPAVSHGFRSSFKDWSNPGHDRFLRLGIGLVRVHSMRRPKR